MLFQLAGCLPLLSVKIECLLEVRLLRASVMYLFTQKVKTWYLNLRLNHQTTSIIYASPCSHVSHHTPGFWVASLLQLLSPGIFTAPKDPRLCLHIILFLSLFCYSLFSAYVTHTHTHTHTHTDSLRGRTLYHKGFLSASPAAQCYHIYPNIC